MTSAPFERRRAALGQVVESLVELNRRLAPAHVTPFADHRLSRPQLELLFILAHRDDVTPKAAAATLSVTAGAITQLVARLRAAGLVTSVPRPQDSRSVLLTLTPAAAAEVAEIEARFLAEAEPLFGALDDQELVQLATLLSRVSIP